MKRPFCENCPDREACHIGASCEYVRQVDALFKQHDARLTKGKKIMGEKNTSKVTPADVAAKAAEENLVVPAQKADGRTPEEVAADAVNEIFEDGVTVTTADTSDQPNLKVIEGGKKTLKERASEAVKVLKANKKGLAATIVVVSTLAGVGVAKFLKSQAEKNAEVEIVEPEPFEDTTDSDETVDAV